MYSLFQSIIVLNWGASQNQIAFHLNQMTFLLVRHNAITE